MSLRIKVVVDKFVEELKEALDADIQDRIVKETEMQSYIKEREREAAEREAAWTAELSRREAEISRQEARLKIERERILRKKKVYSWELHQLRIIKMELLKSQWVEKNTVASDLPRPRKWLFSVGTKKIAPFG